MSYTFVALDCETTGFIPETDRIIEVGCTKFSLAADLETVDVLVNPGVKLPTAVAKLTGITDEELTAAPPFSEHQKNIDTFARGHVIVGHNVVFDLNFLRTHGVDLTNHATLDTYLIAGFILPRVATLSLAGLAEHFGLTHESAHRALSDAEATRDLLRILIEIARTFPRSKWEQIASLTTTAPTWLTTFAEIVLSDVVSKTVGALPVAHTATTTSDAAAHAPEQQLTTLLSTHHTGIQLIETAATADDVATTLTTLQPGAQGSLISVAKNFAARELAKKYTLPIVIAPRYYADQRKVTLFTKKVLTPLQAEFAGKLILHEELNYFEFNLTRAERLDWDFVAADTLPDKILTIAGTNLHEPTRTCPEGATCGANSKTIVTQHDSLPELLERYPELFYNRVVYCTDALKLPATIAKSASLTIDLPTLEKLLPAPHNSLTMWWGLLGMLMKETEPLYGFVDLARATGLTSYARMLESGKSFIADARDVLPQRLIRQLEKFLDQDTSYTRRLRTDQNRSITIVLEKNPDPIASGALIQTFTAAVLLDEVLATGTQDFTYARNILGLPREAAACQIPRTTTSTIELLTLPELPLPTEPDFQKRIDATIVNLINTLPGITVVHFSSRTAMAQFLEKQQVDCNRPVLAEKISGSAGKIALELRKHETATLLTTSQELPARTQNLIIIRLPFTMTDNADWKTETLPLAILNWRRLFANLTTVADAPSNQAMICLDNRLTNKGYGKEFYLSIGRTPTKLTMATGI